VRYPLADNGSADIPFLGGLMSLSICCVPGGFTEGSYSLRPAYAWIRRVVVAGGYMTATIRLVMGGRYKDASFSAPVGDGLYREEVSGTGVAGWAVLRTSGMDDMDEMLAEAEGEVEPAMVAWTGFGVSGITFRNEARISDPLARRDPDFPDYTEVATVNLEDYPLELKSGYNCLLSYDADRGVLVVSGDPGAGLGLPVETPWDAGFEPGVDDRVGLLTVNGAMAPGGDIPLEFGRGITVDRGDGVLVITPSDGS